METSGYSNCSKLTFVNAELIVNEWEPNAWWIYEEVYPKEGGYEFHALLWGRSKGGGLRDLIVTAEDVKYEFSETID